MNFEHKSRKKSIHQDSKIVFGYKPDKYLFTLFKIILVTFLFFLQCDDVDLYINKCGTFRWLLISKYLNVNYFEIIDSGEGEIIFLGDIKGNVNNIFELKL